MPVSDANTRYSYLNDPERLARLALAHAPDRQKWGVGSSYNPEWTGRSEIAAMNIADGETVLEVGVGAGYLRAKIEGRCRYLGTDLQPILPGVLAVNLERDPLPRGPWDVVAMLGVLEYIHDTNGVLAKLFGVAHKVVMSYCVSREGNVMPVRCGRGWVNDLDEEALVTSGAASGFGLTHTIQVNSAEDFDQKIFVFRRLV